MTKKIDFEVVWNHDVLNTQNVDTPVDDVTTDTLLCDITMAQTINIPSASQY